MFGADYGGKMEKAMAPHSSVLAWRIPGTGEPGGLPSLGSHRVGHDRSDLAAWGKCLSRNGKGWFQHLWREWETERSRCGMR